MKNQVLFGLAALFLSISYVSAHAQLSEPNELKAKTWLKSQFSKNQRTVDFPGYTMWGKVCALYLTDKSVDGLYEDYYVVVGYWEAKDQNDYIGGVVSKSFMIMNDTLFSLFSDESWGNGSHWNRVKIVTDAKGNPIKAEGVSDLKSISCNLI